MKKVLIFGGLAIVGYALYNKFGKNLFAKKEEPKTPKDEPKNIITEMPITPKSTGLMGDIDTIKPSIIDSVVVPKKGKFTPNRPIGRPNKGSVSRLPYGAMTLVAVKDCECKQEPCNC